jgi:hypothetical protein
MSRFDRQWQKLTTAARRAADDRDLAAPFGFAGRVAARAASVPPANPWAAVERFAVRGLVVAAIFSVAAVTFNLASFGSDPSDDYAATDTLYALLDQS